MSNVTAINYFKTSLQTVVVASFLLVFRSTINIIFLFTNNHSPYQQFVKNFLKKFVLLALLIINSYFFRDKIMQFII